MNFEDKILALFDDYFQSTPKDEIEKDVAYANSIGFNGVSFEQYLSILNTATSYNLRDTGICDDIAFADMFNNSIKQITMGNDDTIKIGETPNIFIQCKQANLVPEVTKFALAA
jgi:hypothetical protein